MNSFETRLAKFMRKKILEERESRMAGLISGVPKEYAVYREQVGYLRGLADAIEWLDDSQDKATRADEL